MPIKEHVCPHCNFYGTDSETLLVCPDCGCSDVTNTEMLKGSSAETMDYEDTELEGEIHGDEEYFEELPEENIEGDLDL